MNFVTFDASYVNKLRAGDPPTEQHFSTYFSELILLKLRPRLQRPEQIEDVKQETFSRTLSLIRSEGGLRHAELQKSWSQYAQARDNYRAIVLSAFQEVEDGLALTTSLQAQSQDQAHAVADANKAETLSMQLYIGGLIDYLNVVVAQETELTARIAQVGVQASRVQASVDLIRALGGGWSTTDLPAEDRILPLDETDYEHQPQPELDADAASSPR